MQVLPEGPAVTVAQVMAGEEAGIGTGTTVWDASTVLVRYLQHCGIPLAGSRVVDLGSGTGVTGFAAAALGAKVTVTDQSQVLFLLRQNLEANEGSGAVPLGSVSVAEFSWGEDCSHLLTQSPPDIVLACECIVPRLYPIEPLVAAIDDLSGPSTVTFVAYEHRERAFSPQQKFAELAKARGLLVCSIPQEAMDPVYRAEDIEIWRISRESSTDGSASAETGRASGIAKIARLQRADQLVRNSDSDLQPSGAAALSLSKQLKSCGHFCFPGKLQKCCACEDIRPVLPEGTYTTYVDGRGYVDEGSRNDGNKPPGYCPICNSKNYEKWEAKLRHDAEKKEEKKQEARRRKEFAAAAAAADQVRAAAAAAEALSRSDQPEKFEYSNGDVYVGEMQAGVPCGFGKMHYSDDGSDRLENSLVTYEGQWMSGKHHGQGKKDWGDGIVYEGEYQHGQMHGSGRYTLEDGYIMEGKFEHDEFMGDMS